MSVTVWFSTRSDTSWRSYFLACMKAFGDNSAISCAAARAHSVSAFASTSSPTQPRAKLQGHLNYFAVPGNDPSLWWFFNEVRWRWLKSLKRRGQGAYLNWDAFTRLTDCFFPPIRI
jgi:hypothetical protein